VSFSTSSKGVNVPDKNITKIVIEVLQQDRTNSIIKIPSATCSRSWFKCLQSIGSKQEKFNQFYDASRVGGSIPPPSNISCKAKYVKKIQNGLEICVMSGIPLDNSVCLCFLENTPNFKTPRKDFSINKMGDCRVCLLEIGWVAKEGVCHNSF